MRYENYQKRIEKIAGVLRVILLKWKLLLLALISALVAISAFLFFKGTVLYVNCEPSASYGEDIQYNALALFSQTYLEYQDDFGEWSTKAPTLPGQYQLRVVGKGFFGTKASKGIPFTIDKRAISITSLDGTVLYGENPVLTADLAYNDFLYCEKFESSDVFLKDGEGLRIYSIPQEDAIVIKDIYGNDVTFAYEIEVIQEELRVIPREITVTVRDASKVYDGTALTFDGYELSEGTLANGDSLFAYFTKSITNSGSVENTPEIILLNPKGHDVTPCYNLTIVAGLLTVEKRPLILKTQSGEFGYDGLPHMLDQYEISRDTSLVAEQHLTVFWGMLTDAGEYKNLPAIVNVSTEDGVDVTENYSIFFEAGTLTIRPLPLTVSTNSGVSTYQGAEQRFSFFGFKIEEGTILNGHSILAGRSGTASDVGTYINDTEVIIAEVKSGKDVTHNYDITYIRGTIEIKKRTVRIETASGEWVYDGRSHQNENFASTSLGLNDKIIVTESTAVTEVGTYPNILTVKIVKEEKDQPPSEDNSSNTSGNEGEGVDVTANYDIVFTHGRLEVKKRPITIKPVDANKVYDAEPLTSTTVQVSPKSENNLITGHTLSNVQTSGTLTDVGAITNYIIPASVSIQSATGMDVTHNYDVKLSVGLLSVTPREILIQTGSATKEYDGTALTSQDFAIGSSFDTLVAGHTVTVENIGSLSCVGKAQNIFRLDKTSIHDANGNDVTKNYRIKYSYGILEIYGNAAANAFSQSGQIGSFRDDLTDTSTDEASSISIKDDRAGYIYLRLKSFGGYAGSGWYEATEYPELLLGKYSANYLSSLTFGADAHTLSVNVKNPLSFMPYYASVYSSTQGTTGELPQTSDVFYNVTSASGGNSIYTVSYKDYDYISPLVLPEEYAEYEQAYRAFVYSQYLILDDETRAYMEKIIEKEDFFETDIEGILSVAKYIQNSAKYNPNYDVTLDETSNVAVSFLQKYQEGISQHFATALTLLYRAMGIPARYVVGYATSTAKNEWVNVERNQIHAWVEVYIDGAGWIEIEATGSPEFGLNGSGGKEPKPCITVKPVYRSKVFDGTPLTASSLIEYDPVLSELASKGYFWSLKVSGSLDMVGRGKSTPTRFTLYDPIGNDVTDQFNIIFENGTLEVFDSNTYVIKIGLARLQKQYDGMPLTFGPSDCSITDPAGVSLSLNISLTDVGCLTLSELNENAHKYVTISRDLDDYGKKIVVTFTQLSSAVWSTAMMEPILTIDQRAITVTASSAFKLFDGTPLTSDVTYITKGDLCEGHTMKVTLDGSIDHVGRGENRIMRVVIKNKYGEDVTVNYKITTVSGVLTVLDNTNFDLK